MFGAFKVDPDGLQIAHEMVVFQWQDGKKIVVWPADRAHAPVLRAFLALARTP